MHARKAPRDGSAHPVRDGSSHTQYYHTVTAASSNKSPMTKVMDIFRNRSHASVPPEDRRKVGQLFQFLRNWLYSMYQLDMYVQIT
jgi:lysyl-tRNA synthetase class I